MIGGVIDVFSKRTYILITPPFVEIIMENNNEQRALGKIIKVSDKGWGFIISKDIAFTRIFFHWTSLTGDTLNFKDLKLGMNVEFTPIDVPNKGWRAIKIKVMDGQ